MFKMMMLLVTVSLLTCKASPLSPPKIPIVEGHKGEARKDNGQTNGDANRTQDVPSANVRMDTQNSELKASLAEQEFNVQRKLEWFTGALVFAGFAQVIAIVWQGWLMFRTLASVSRQADLMTVQANLQAVGMRQWVEVQLIDFRDVGRLQDPSGGLLPSGQIEFSFEVKNTTLYPLTFQRAKALVHTVGFEDDVIFVCTSEARLIPGDANGSRIVLKIAMKLSQQVLIAYRLGMLYLSIAGVVQFVPAVGPLETQEYGFAIEPNPVGAKQLPFTIEMAKEEVDND